MQLYIDPGTGSMLFTILLGAATTVYFLARRLWIRMKFRLSGGRGVKDSKRIPYVIFSEGKKYWNVFEPVCDEFERRGVELEYWTADPADPALEKVYSHVKTRFIGEGNKAYAKLNFLNAAVCLSTTPGLDVYQWKRSRDTAYYVHILHAAGTSAGGYRMFSLDFYDAVLLTGAYQIEEIRELERKRNEKEKELEVVGCTYMDALKRRLDEAGPASHEDTVVLLAPSWGKSSILCRFGEKLIDCLLESGCRLIIRPHPQAFTSDKDTVEALLEKYPDSAMLRWDREPDNFASLNEADILISDFSSVVFDFSLIFNKPFIYAEGVFDKGAYDAAWLDEELWKFRVLPRLGVPLKEEQFPQIKEVIDEALADTSLAEGRAAAREEAWAHIGESAVRVADHLIRKYGELTAAGESEGRQLKKAAAAG